MGILSKSIRNPRDVPRKGRDAMSKCQENISWNTFERQYDCTSEPFSKPTLSSTLIHTITLTSESKKQNIFKCIISDLAIQLDRVIVKAFGNSQAYNVTDDLSLHECEVFVITWSEELKCFEISKAERFRRCLECLNIREDKLQKLTDAQKDFVWFIHILNSLPKSSLCQEECAKEELLNLYILWKKGQLISMLPIMDFIMRTLLSEKDYILKRKLQQETGNGKRNNSSSGNWNKTEGRECTVQ